MIRYTYKIGNGTSNNPYRLRVKFYKYFCADEYRIGDKIQFKDIGFFDENFFIYLEEIDLCRRLRKANKKIYLDTSIIINHIGGSSHNQSINFEMEMSRNWHWMWSTFYYQKKYNGFIFALFKVSKKLISSLIKVLFYSLIFNQKKKKIYYQRFSGLINSIFGKKSWYRPKLL